MSLNTLFSVLQKHKKIFFYLLFWAGVFFFTTQYGFAAAGDQTVLSEEDAAKITKILNGFITWAAALMWMVTSFISIFLYPGWVNGTWFGLDEYLQKIWIMVSNVVYFIFAFILIAIAFMNIIWKTDNNTWELKQAMPKFIVWVLIVPFSWFFVQFVLSISAVLTVWVLTLPYDSFQGDTLFESALENEMFADQWICKDVIISFSWEFEEGTSSLTEWDADNALDENIRCKSDDSKVTVREILTGVDSDGNISADWWALQNSIFGIISVYSYGILRIQELDTIAANDLNAIKTIADLVFKIVFDLLFIAVYLLLMIALMLALFARWVRLWLYAMMSPVFGLLYFFWAKEWFWDEQKFSVKEFIALALVPVYVSAALAFGLTFILVASEWIKKNSESSDTLQAGWFSLTITGAKGDGEVETSVIGKLIVEIFWVAILWIAVMFALKQSEVTRQITAPIAEFGKSVGQLAAKAPTYAPIIPTWSGWMSVEWLRSFGSRIEQGMRWASQTKWSEFAQWFLPWQWNTDSPQSAIRDIFARSWIASNSASSQKLEVIQDTLEAQWANLRTDRRGRDELERQLSNIWVSVEISNLTDFNRLSDELFKWMQEAWIPVQNAGWSSAEELRRFLEWRATNPQTRQTAWAEDAAPVAWETVTNIRVNWGIHFTPESAGKGYAEQRGTFDTEEKVREDLRSQNVDDSIITSVIAAYNEAINEADSDWWDTA